MKFVIEVDGSTLQKIRKFQAEAQNFPFISAKETIRQLFMLSDMGSGWLEDLTAEIGILEIQP